MAAGSSIEWTQATWNPVTGCTKVSAGCKNCYAERMGRRLQAMGVPQYSNGFAVTTHPEMLDRPYRWRKPRLIFVNSMSDLFHERVRLSFIRDVFHVMNECPQHTFQVLTKRPEVAVRCADKLTWTDNIWIGTSVEHMLTVDRIRALQTLTQAAVRFLSLEPLLGPLARMPLKGIDWAIVGGESGPGARPMDPRWVRQIRDHCVARGVPFFFKQWGGVNKKKAGRLLDGRTWDEMPPIANTRGITRVSAQPA
ncbi:MAG: phage Gp37/Gp68 family protein [Phycisphaerales bacterium]|nr:phage Gp37/Gp68 family protein [Phycisphaerales bacterium]